MEPWQCCCMPIPLAFHFNVHVNRLDQFRVSPISTLTHTSSRQKSTWKRPVVNHMDITPAFNYIFNVVFVHYVTDMERTQTTAGGQLINMEYGKQVLFPFFVFQLQNRRRMDREQYVLPSLVLNVLHSNHFLFAATQMWGLASLSIQSSKYKNMISFFSHSFLTSLNEYNISS